MEKDITNRNDIILLVDEFYKEVRNDQMLGTIFDDIMKISWEKHLPKMYDFWDSILFHANKYKGFPFAAHLPVNEKIKLTPAHFDHWLSLFYTTVDKLFEGSNTEQIKIRASTIKEIWSAKMNYINSEIEMDQPHH